ncbi:HK97 family phage prohead protease [Rhodanobacter thiooxydans]|jgi:HK97 family phage prohead protease|uniref:HK97 family phage prohead protease n=1 Tax=Rhodanobacter thiooxydans TaxID=416169 RepID=UPI000D3BE649|nr:HK97 family phage prohead protease [Rhodanobacter thiooxydans]
MLKLLHAKLLDASAAAGTFTGYAATFGPQPDRQGDVISPHAFDDTLATWAARGMNVPLLADHDPLQPLGAITAAEVDAVGLSVTGRIAVDTEAGQRAYALARIGGLSMSVQFTANAADIRNVGGVQVIDALDLIEVSLVAVPANPDARLSGIKAFADMQSPTDFERAIRRALDLTQRQAKQATAAAWPLLRRDGAIEIERREGVSADVTKRAVAILLRSASRL